MKYQAKRLIILFLIFFVFCAYTGVYHGNTETKVFHKSSCQYFNCENCTEVFTTRDEAINAGYRPCQVCDP